MFAHPDKQATGNEAAFSAVALSPFKAEAWRHLTSRERFAAVGQCVPG